MKLTIPLITLACGAPLVDADRDAEPITMLKISVQHVTSADQPGFKTGIFSPKETAQWLRRAAGREGIELRLLPPITCRPDQDGTIELIRMAPT